MLEIFANQFEVEGRDRPQDLRTSSEVADWGLDGATHSPVPRIGWGHPLSGTKDWMGPPTLRYQGNVDGPWYLSTMCCGTPSPAIAPKVSISGLSTPGWGTRPRRCAAVNQFVLGLRWRQPSQYTLFIALITVSMSSFSIIVSCPRRLHEQMYLVGDAYTVCGECVWRRFCNGCRC